MADDPHSGDEQNRHASGGCMKSCREARLLSTGDMARMTASTLRTVRFYDEEGLICPTSRSEGGHRLYESTQVSRLQLILDLKESGLSLGQIRTLLALKAGCPTAGQASKQLAEVLEKQIACLQRKTAALQRLRDEMTASIAVIDECKTCEERKYPKECSDCEVTSRPNLPRALRIFWGI